LAADAQAEPVTWTRRYCQRQTGPAWIGTCQLAAWFVAWSQRPGDGPPADEGIAPMIGRLLIAAGALLVVAGTVFALQGFGVLGGSVMSGSSLWAALGPLIAAAGLLIAVAGLRRIRSSSSARR
jgi:hypothetical protein